MGAVRVIAVVVVVVVLAGCGAFAEQTDREPYGVEEPVDPTDGEILPGLTHEEVTDSTALLSTHHETLEEEAYEVRTTRLERGERTGEENEPHVRWTESTRTVSADRATASITGEQRTHSEGENATASPNDSTTQPNDSIVQQAVWLTDETSYFCTLNESGEVSYGENADPIALSPSFGLPMDRLYDAAETIEQGDDGRIELTATEVEVERLFENATYTIVLAEDGYVERYDLEGTTAAGNRLLEITWSLELLEEPDLTEPDWLEEAKAEAEADEAETDETETEDEDDEGTEGG